ncbi:MAG: DNA gyrase inhibitor YacG [Ghiorsea sp.]|nr:DNA gyrase inhibitor YacG [Ghiorsea sp.]
MSKKIIVKCPICKTQVERQAETFPFCSNRCKTYDLGKWASGAYTIPDANENCDSYNEGEHKVTH